MLRQNGSWRVTTKYFGHEIENRKMCPDKNRLQPLLDMVKPKTFKELQQVRGLFAYDITWIYRLFY